MLKANRFLLVIALFLFMVFMGSCGGGGGGGTNPPSDTTTVSGTVSPPAGVSLPSLTILSLGDTSPVSTTGSFTTEVYKEGVAVVAAMPEGKEFGLMNVVATSTTPTSSAESTKGQMKIISAYQAASDSSIELNAKTTAVSMVFITPYFLTNDPEKAANIISIIENNSKVTSLANVIESVFNESDPLSNSTLQQALIDAVQSVLDTVSAQASMATKTRASSFPKILQLPKSSLAKSLKALFVANPPYYADQDYMTVKAIETTSGYDVSVESKNGGSVDWIAGAMQLDSSQFSSLLDLQVKASNNRSLYENEQSHILGELDATAKSYFRYFDLISTAFDWAFSEVFGNALEDRVTVPSTQDGIYLIRAYSGGWGMGVDHEGQEEKSFVRIQVPNGSTMDTKSLSINGFMVIFDTMSAFVAIDKLFPDEMNEVAKAGLEEAFSKVPYVIGNPDPNMRDLISVSADITKATLSKLTEILMEQLSKNFLKTIYRTTEIIGKSVVNLATLNTVIELGKPADRLLQLLVSATPMETAIIVVGEPFPTPVDTEKPSTPTNLKTVAVSSAQIDLSWDASTDNVGVAGYKIYRNGSHLRSVTTTLTSDTGLDTSTQYCYTVSAYDAAGNESEQSNQACATTLSTPDITPPSIPTGLTAAAISSSQIDLSWNASSDDVGVAGYKIYDYYGTYLNSVTSTSTSITGLNPNTQYCFSVSAYDAAGNESGQSSQACATTTNIISSTTWAKTYGGIDVNNGNESSYDSASSIQQTSDGGYIVAGKTDLYSYLYTSLGLTSTLTNTCRNAWILKLKSDGTVSWSKTYRGHPYEPSCDTSVFSSIQQTSDSGYIVAGTTSKDYGGFNFWVLKLDKDGYILWEKIYRGDYDDYANSIQQTSDGGYIVAGTTASFGSGEYIWVLKLDKDGNVLWEKIYGGHFDSASSIQQTSDGGYIVAGTTYSFETSGFPNIFDPEYDSDIWLLKLDGNGNVLWQRTYGGIGEDSDDIASSIQQTPDGGYIVAGETKSFGDGKDDVWVLKLDKDGNVLWQKTYGGSSNDRAFSIQQTSDGGYIIAGETYSFGVGSADFWVLKLDSAGNVLWQKTYGGSYIDSASSIRQTSDGGYIVAGRTYSFGVGSADFWVLKLDPNGNIGTSCSMIGQSSAKVTDTYVSGVESPNFAKVYSTKAFVTSTNSCLIEPYMMDTVQCSIY